MISPSESTDLEPLPRDTWNIRKASGRGDAFYLVRQWDYYWGAEYETNRLPSELAEVAGWHDEDEQLDVFGTIATHDDSESGDTVRIGGGLASAMDHDRAVEELPDGRFDPDALVGSKNVWLWFGVVDPQWRGRGIGHQMFKYRLDWARAIGAEMVFAIGWERRDGRTSRPLFEAYDFVPIQRFEDFYEGDRDACPDCGSWQSNDVDCECPAVLWALDLPEDA